LQKPQNVVPRRLVLGSTPAAFTGVFDVWCIGPEEGKTRADPAKMLRVDAEMFSRALTGRST
jgi:hypothetical protein